MKFLVQKFGGTSVATEQHREAVAGRVHRALREGYLTAVVVSAMGRAGDPYATDTIKGLAESIFPRLSLRELDLIMSCGEIISAVVMTATLQKAGIRARSFTGAQAGLVTDGLYGRSQVTACRPEPVRRYLEAGEVAVVAGFQGATLQGEINTLGRGGSDTTAVILGAALGAERVEIYTDVDGISTADPRLLEEARVIPRLTYSEVCQMAYDGAKVIHPVAVEVAMQHNVPVLVRSLTGEEQGTLICSGMRPAESGFFVEPHRVVAGIAHSAGIVQIVVDFPEPDPDLEMSLFENLGEAGVSIDLISVFPRTKAFTVKEADLLPVGEVLDKLKLKFKANKDCAKVSVVGLGMRGIPGVMARVVRALKKENIAILQTADSNISISALIRQEDLQAAIKTLHNHFGLGEAGAAEYTSAAIPS